MREQFSITHNRFNSLTVSYISRMGPVAITGDIASYKGNLERAIRQTRMTWNVFLRVLAVMNIQQFDFAIIIQDEDRKISRSSVTVDLRKGPDTEENEEALAKLFKQILDDIHISPQQFWEHLDRYVKSNRPDASPTELQNHRGHLKKELLKKKISWNVFVKGMVFLDLPGFRIEISLQHYSKTVTIHQQDVYLSPDHINQDLFENESGS